MEPGASIGPYRIVSLAGTGGMGAVYRAHDPGLRRDVALKVLPERLAADPEFLARFEREAQAASGLSHPNIVTVYGVGREGAVHYIAMELLDGRTLRDLLREGPLPTRKAAHLAQQIAEGLAAAHARGIVHRDLKPENVMVSAEGHVKILDFGLAKIVTTFAVDPGGSTAHGVRSDTEPGTILGTAAYMSPEQASGTPADFRTDQFSLGAVLYEMLTGRAAFRRSTAAETLCAILREEPEPVQGLESGIAVPMRWILDRCLAKAPGDRYASTRDLAQDLGNLRHELSRPVTRRMGISFPVRGRAAAAAALLVAVGLALGALWARKGVPASAPQFKPLTFSRGTVWSGRFGPDGSTIFYGAAWEGRPFQIFRKAAEGSESLPLTLSSPSADLLAVSSQGEIAILVDLRIIVPGRTAGVLAVVPATGGAPRRLAEDVEYADWAPEGRDLAVVRAQGGKTLLEYPIGTTRYESTGWLSHPRVARDGTRLAFLEHPMAGDDRGVVRLMDAGGRITTASEGWGAVQGLAWAPDGNEIWVSGTGTLEPHTVYAIDAGGQRRPVVRAAGNLRLLDVSSDGKVLVARQDRRLGISFRHAGGGERDLSLQGSSFPAELSADGSTVLFTEFGEAGGAAYSVWVRKTDGSPAVRLGDGLAKALSPDLAWALVSQPVPRPQLMLMPTGAGQSRAIDVRLEHFHQASFLPDGRRFLIAGNEAGHGTRLYTIDLKDASQRPISPEGILPDLHAIPVSPDQQRVAALASDGRVHVYFLNGGEPHPLAGATPGMVPLRWSADGRHVYAARLDEVPSRIQKIDAASGRSDLWVTLVPADSAGVHGFPAIFLAADERTLAYSYARFLSELYLVTGVR